MMKNEAGLVAPVLVKLNPPPALNVPVPAVDQLHGLAGCEHARIGLGDDLEFFH